MANRYNRLDNQSPVTTQMKADSVSVGRSAHDCSHVVSGNTMYGLIAPVLTMEVVPNEDIDLSVVALLEFRNPTTRQLLNGSRVFFHAYYNRLDDLWEGARNWLDNGRSGKIQLNRPNLIYHATDSNLVAGKTCHADANTPLSLLAFMGLPPSHMQLKIEDYPDLVPPYSTYRDPIRQFQTAYSETVDDTQTPVEYFATMESLSNYTDYFPADVCMAYQRNWRDFYSNKNLLQKNKYWFPDNEDHFILSYSCENAVAIKYEDEDLSNSTFNQVANLLGLSYTDPSSALHENSLTLEPNNPDTTSSIFDASNYPNLAGIKFRQFRGDRFTTASPFSDLIRGDIPSLLLDNDSLSKLSVKANVQEPSSGTVYSWGEVYTHNGANSSAILGQPSEGTPDSIGLFVENPLSTLTMSDIYTLETLTAFRRRMGMTNGDYNEMIKAQYGVDPNVHSRKGTYIGGFYQDFAFSSVTQTSQSDTTPLGTKAGQGVSSGQGKIGHFHTPDFGWISVYMSVSYDTMYTQGKPRQFSKKSNMEMYFPIFNNLPAQAIRNDELFVSGNATTDSTPFAYEDRYAEFKSMPNRVCGFMSLSPSVARFDASKIMARRFTSTPSLNHLFVTMVPENQDMSVFTVDNEPPFDFSIGFNIRRVFPGPYTAIEGSLSSPLLNRS